jgi:hypothetical protein
MADGDDFIDGGTGGRNGNDHGRPERHSADVNAHRIAPTG